MTITLTAADLRDPMDSEETCCTVEGPVEREADGSCYCSCASANDWEEDAATPLPLHLHLKVWGRKPEAAPRYFEILLR